MGRVRGHKVGGETAKAIIVQLKSKGAVTRGWIGVQAQTVDSGLAVGLGLPKAEGALEDDSQQDSPASKAGVAAGDVIMALDGAPLKDSRELAKEIDFGPCRIPASLDVTRLADLDDSRSNSSSSFC